jgi:hypothetical protein
MSNEGSKGVPKASSPPIAKVPPWHATTTKHEFPTQPLVDRAFIFLGVVVVCNEDEVFQLKGALIHNITDPRRFCWI